MHASLSEHVADLVQNAVEAGAALVAVDVIEADGWVEVCVADNGKGMDAETLAGALDPFRSEPGKHPGRRVGLGLPFVRQAAEQAGGGLEVNSEPGAGTSVCARFRADHADTPPLGDFAGTALQLMTLPGGFELALHRRRADRSYSATRSELAEALGGLDGAESLSLARRYLREQEVDLTKET